MDPGSQVLDIPGMAQRARRADIQGMGDPGDQLRGPDPGEVIFRGLGYPGIGHFEGPKMGHFGGQIWGPKMVQNRGPNSERSFLANQAYVVRSSLCDTLGPHLDRSGKG